MTKWLKDVLDRGGTYCIHLPCAVSGKDYRSLALPFQLNCLQSHCQWASRSFLRPSLSDYLARSLTHSYPLSLARCACLDVCLFVLSCPGQVLTLLCLRFFVPPRFWFLVHSTSSTRGASTLAQRNLISKGHVWCRPRSVPAAPPPPAPPSCAQSLPCIACKTSISWSSRLIKLVFPAPNRLPSHSSSSASSTRL